MADEQKELTKEETGSGDEQTQTDTVSVDFGAFDPTAIITDGGDEDGGQFEDLVSQEVSASSDEINAELKTGNFGSVDIKDFSEFNTPDYIPTAGEYVFSVEQKFLKAATSITRLTASASKSSFGTAKVTLFSSKMRLATFNQTAFSEVFIPVHGEVQGIEEGKEISFIFDQNILAKIASTFVDAVITFIFNADKNLLVITSDKTRLELSTAPETDFVKYHSKIGDPTYLNKINTEVLRKGLNYVASFVKKDDIQLNLSLIDVKDQMMVGGAYSAIGIFQSPAFLEIEFKVKYEIIGILEKIAGHFHDANTHLFETENFYILRDENLYFGFEKTTFNFPPVAQFFQAPTTGDQILIPRGQLLNSLYKLSVVSIDKDLLVQVKITGSGNDSEIYLATKDSTGKISEDTLQIYRGAEEDKDPAYDDREYYLNIAALIKIVNHFESANVQFREISGKAILIEDEDDLYQATTILSMLNEAQVQAQKAAKDKAKLSASKKADTTVEHP